MIPLSRLFGWLALELSTPAEGGFGIEGEINESITGKSNFCSQAELSFRCSILLLPLVFVGAGSRTDN